MRVSHRMPLHEDPSSSASLLAWCDRSIDDDDTKKSLSGSKTTSTARRPSFALIRHACNNCWLKKRKCTGEKPCSRCKRGGVACSYSTKAETGRPRKGEKRRGQPYAAGGGGSKKSRAPALAALVSTNRPAFSVSPATGLAGLAESHFLACFLEHCAPL